MDVVTAAWIRPYRLRLLPISVALVIASTAMPVELRSAVGFQADLRPIDVAGNLLLYAPLGLALWRRPLRIVLVFALALSLLIETSQTWSVGRYPSLIDSAANALGAGIAAKMWRPLQHEVSTAGLRIGRAWIVASATGMVLVMIAWTVTSPWSGLSAWNPAMPLQGGADASGDRAWRGSIGHLSLRAPIAVPSDPATDGAAVIRFGEIPSLSGRTAPPDAVRAFAQAAMRTNEFAVEARVIPETTARSDAARIVSFSTDSSDGNFDLSLEARMVVFRVCTRTIDGKCIRLRLNSRSVLKAGESVRIRATYDAGIVRIHVDDVLAGRRNLAAAACRVPALCDATVPLIWAVLGALASLIALAFAPWRNRCRASAIAAVAAIGALALPRLLQVGEVPIGTHPWAQLVAFFGAATVAISAQPVDGPERFLDPGGPKSEHSGSAGPGSDMAQR